VVVDSAGPVDSRASPHARLRSLPGHAVALQDGFWSRWQALNRDVSLGHGLRMLEQAGNLDNLRIAAGQLDAQFRGPVFMDSDVYKWLEAVAFEVQRDPTSHWPSKVDRIVDLICAAQQSDGYLNSYYQVAEPGRRWTDITHGHEMYCAGHLAQAAIAWYRAAGDDRLLRVTTRLMDLIDAEFGPGKRDATPGHPEIEMSLVELYRATGERRYVHLAQTLLDRRGRGLLTGGRFNSAYYQDRVPVREASTIEGHAVRAVYLACGVTDVYLETGDSELRSAIERQWHDMVEGKQYVTGGLGSRHSGESFGQPFELPNETAYCETCAAIGNVMWNWRLLLATGEARFADEIERALFNGFLSGISLAGDRFFYVNPLLSRGRDEVLSRTAVERLEWWRVACCPPNVMRMLASLNQYVATSNAAGVQVHQYASARVTAGSVRLSVATEYPWDGNVSLTVEATSGDVWRLALRIPAWSSDVSVRVNGESVEVPVAPGSYVELDRAWRPGDQVELSLDVRPRLVAAHPSIESTTGCAAIQRGPLVYCIEQADHVGHDVLDIALDSAVALKSDWQADVLGGVMTVGTRGLARDHGAWHGQLYQPLTSVRPAAGTPVEVRAIPYYAWANRGPGGMRVWIPLNQAEG